MPQSLKHRVALAHRSFGGRDTYSEYPSVGECSDRRDSTINHTLRIQERQIVGVNLECKPHQIQLTWNIPGPAGAPGGSGRTRAEGGQR